MTIVEPAQPTATRRELTKLLLPGARELHFKKEKPPRRRLLLDLHAHRLVLDSRDHRNAHDRRTLQRALGVRPSKTELIYEHLDSAAEPLLWISDAVAWCHGAGGDWRRRVAAIVSQVVVL